MTEVLSLAHLMDQKNFIVEFDEVHRYTCVITAKVIDTIENSKQIVINSLMKDKKLNVSSISPNMSQEKNLQKVLSKLEFDPQQILDLEHNIHAQVVELLLGEHYEDYATFVNNATQFDANIANKFIYDKAMTEIAKNRDTGDKESPNA